jgi:hypothetical protein
MAETKPSPVQKHRGKSSVPLQRTVAKTGMAASLGVLVWSAMARGRGVMRYHTLAGVALLGFAVWHIALYKSRDKIYEDPRA